ncbi:MAG: helix-turn-helix domain-containing protein [Sedimentisphaerales bacterium]|nr:helix-turn-helix domain-containing protein [Sedimentisphaerales bacterium]
MQPGTSIIPPAVVSALPNLSGAAAKLAIALGKFADKDGKCFPSIETLMHCAGIKHWQTFKNARTELKDRGLLAWKRDSRRQSFRYVLANRVPAMPIDTQERVPAEIADTGVPVESADPVPVRNAGRVPAALAEGTPHTTPHRIPHNNIFTSDSDEFRLAALLLDLIRNHKPDFKKPNLQTWAKHIDRMIRLDKRKPETIEAVIRWCQQDSFWYKIVLSTESLRKKFDQLEINTNDPNRPTIKTGRSQRQAIGGRKYDGSENDWEAVAQKYSAAKQ